MRGVWGPGEYLPASNETFSLSSGDKTLGVPLSGMLCGRSTNLSGCGVVLVAVARNVDGKV